MAAAYDRRLPLTGGEPPPEAELAELYRAEYDRVLRLAVLMLGDRAAAEDVVHDAFLAVHRKWDSLQDPSAAAGYLRVCVVNGSRSQLRRRRTWLRSLRGPESDLSGPVDEASLLGAEHRATVLAVRRLPKRQQQVVVLRYWLGASEAEIAAELGISTGTVKSTAARGLASIRKHLGDLDAL